MLLGTARHPSRKWSGTDKKAMFVRLLHFVVNKSNSVVEKDIQQQNSQLFFANSRNCIKKSSKRGLPKISRFVSWKKLINLRVWCR